jgi:hypothetical protein
VDTDRVGPRDGLPRDERRRAGSCPQFQERNALTAAAAVTITAVIIDCEPNGSTLFSFYGLDDQKLSLPASTKLLLVSRAAPSRQSMINLKTISLRRDRKSETTTCEKWPQKRPFC